MWPFCVNFRTAASLFSCQFTVDGAKETEGAKIRAPMFLYKSWYSSSLQTVRVGLHIRQQRSSLMNQAVCNLVRNRGAMHFGSLE
jgi:hypothetical protein